MSDSNFPLSADEDLPRTFRRARLERDAALNQAAQRSAPAPAPLTGDSVAPIEHASAPVKPHVVVRELKIPFFHLMMFFIKAVFAAIPALILLSALLWLGGEFLTSNFPELLKMKILIQFPN